MALVALGLALSVPHSQRAEAQNYGPDVTLTGAAYSCGDYSGHPDTYAFDDSTSTAWFSSQAGSAIAGHACIGQEFSAAYDIRQISIRQGSNAQERVLSVYWQYSDDCVNWHTITVITLPDDGNKYTYSDLPVANLHLCWRILAAVNPTTGSDVWANIEIEMMEAIGNPSATPVYTATSPSATPTITLTPSTTPSPTPNYFVEVTSTQGSPMRLERSATFGDIGDGAIGIAQVILLFLVLAVLVWKRG